MTRRCVYVCLLLCLAGGCSLSEDLHLSSLAQAYRCNEVIQELEAQRAAGQHLSSFRLFFFSYAYLYVRRYDKVLVAADLLEQSVAAGDTGAFGGSLRPYPWFFRAQVYMDYGDYPKAIQAASRAYAILQQESSQDNSSRSRTILPGLGSMNRRSSQNSFSRVQIIDIIGTRGLAYALSGQKAQSQADLAIVSSVDISRSNLGPDKHIALARIHMANHDFRDALAEMSLGESEAPAVLTAFYDKSFQTLPRDFIISKCLYETGQLDRARQAYDRLLAYPFVGQVGSIYWVSLFDRARIARAEQHPDEAIRLLAKAIVVLEEHRASIHSEVGKIGFVGDKQSVYEEIVSLLVEQGRDTEAFEYVERAKARALVDLLASQKDLAARREHSQQIAEQMAHLAQAEKELAILPDPGDQTTTEKTRGTVLGLRKQIAAQAPELASLIAVQWTSVRQLQALLGPDETVLEYYRCGSSWYVFAMSRESLKARKLQAKDLEAAVAHFRKRLSAQDSTDYLPSAQRLYADLVAPAQDLIQGKRLVVVPHGPLHYLPFAALHDGKEYLVDRFSLRMLPSATVLEFLKSAKVDETKGVLAVGNPDLGDPRLDLKFAEAEAKAVVAKVGAGRSLVRGEATETAVKPLMGQYRMLHFATHGVFSPAAPLESRLLLARDGQNDGQLTIGKLYSLQLDADLVTLSGCDTAMGQVANGDDVVGFTRGLLYAGARSIVSSLWEVDDEATGDLMVAFYENLRSLPQQEALRAAQRKLKEQKPHPYFWAAFQLTGASGAN